MINTLVLITMISVFTRMYIIEFESGIISITDPVSRGSIEEEVHSALHDISLRYWSSTLSVILVLLYKAESDYTDSDLVT